MTSPADRPNGHTRWKRLALVVVPTLVASAILLVAVNAGAVPVSLAIAPGAAALSGDAFQISADTLDGHGFTQYAGVNHTPHGDFPGGVSGIRSADLYNLCQSAVTELPVLGKVTLRIAAGGGGKPAHADHLVVNTDDLRGDAVFGNITIGQDAATLNGVSGGPSGGFGQQADTVRIDHLRQDARSVTAATFRLTGLHLTVKTGAKPCW